MPFQPLLCALSLLLAAWSPFANAQEAESDVKALPLRTHSLQTVGPTVGSSLFHTPRLTSI